MDQAKMLASGFVFAVLALGIIKLFVPPMPDGLTLFASFLVVIFAGLFGAFIGKKFL
ncbi:MAG: hypothetical protein JW772_01985 [Candidatus Diapherotrites archaeon]|nr:hypothetical protein [Candidatus Diapherotrites archaeon]